MPFGSTALIVNEWLLAVDASDRLGGAGETSIGRAVTAGARASGAS